MILISFVPGRICSSFWRWLEKLKQWFDVNKLSLNLNKTKFMLFGNRTIPVDTVQIMIDNVHIERVYENKFLGVILDHKICWKPHINHIRTKLAKSVAILGRTRYMLDYKSLHILYSSLVLPYLYYCVEVWGNTYKSNLQPLFKLQKRAIRIAHNVGYKEHMNTLFLKSHT